MYSKEEWDKAVENASEAMIQALNAFGPSETLNLLLCVSSDDPIVNHLLTKYPSAVAFGEFFNRMRPYKKGNNKVKGKIGIKREKCKPKTGTEEAISLKDGLKKLGEPQDSSQSKDGTELAA